RSKRLDVHRRVWIQLVPVLVKAVPERADGKDPEVNIDREKIDDVAHLAEDDGAQNEENDEPEDERHPAHLEKIGLLDRLHPDVMIQIVDLDEMLAVESPALDFVTRDVEIEPIGI